MERFSSPQKGFALSAEDIADALWLALHMGEVVVPESSPTEGDQRGSDQIRQADQISPGDQRLPRGLPPLPPIATPQSEIYPTGADSEVSGGVPIQVPDAAALRHPLSLMRSLRPLMRKVPSRVHSVLDEDATVNRIADEKVWLPVLRPAPERWLELALVIEETTALPIWQRTIQEFQQLVGRHGAFRDVRTWRLVPDLQSGGELQLFPGEGRASSSGRARSPKELLDATQRRLIVLISDCVSPAWQSGQMVEWLRPFADLGMVSVMQLLPERYWERTALGRGYPVEISALAPGLPNAKLTVQGLPDWAVAPSMPLETPEETTPPLPNQSPLPVLMTLPIVTLDPQLMQDWAQMLAAIGGNQTAGRVLDPAILAQHNGVEPELPDGEQRFQRFWSTASPPARQLAGYLATVPISMPVVRLVQRVLLPESSPMHVAEVFFSGILRPAFAQEARADYVQYEFVAPEIRDRLRRTMRLSDGQEVIEQVSGYIAEKLGLATRDFQAVLRVAVTGNASHRQYLEPFARIASPFLQRLGGDFAALANIAHPNQTVEIAQRVAEVVPTWDSPASLQSIVFPPLQILEFVIVQLVDDLVENSTLPSLRLQTELFTVATLTLEPEPNRDFSPNHMANLEWSAQRALEFVAELLERQESVRLNDLQKAVFIKIWQGKAYKEIRQEIRQEGDREYSLEYLSQDVGPNLCKLLSRALGKRVTKKNFRSPILNAQAKATANLTSTSEFNLDSSVAMSSSSMAEQNQFTDPSLRPASLEPTEESPFYVDWMNAPDEPLFVGRNDELDDLSEKILMQNCRMIVIYGLVGIGKTALAVQLAQRVKSDFDILVWRSLQDNPPLSLDALLLDLWQTLLGFQSLPPEPTVDLNRLLRYLSDHRCLILLDGLDITYREGVHDGSYREGYKALGAFLERVGTRPHQSCFVLTSQNNPKEIAMMAVPQVYSHRMKGLSELAGGDMLLARGIIAPPDYDFRSLIQRFAGHPQALRQFAATAKELCQGDLVTFLEQIGEDFPVCDYIQHQLDSTFTHLSELERSLLGGLTAINEPATLEQIRYEVIRSSPLNLSPGQVSEVLRSLLRRALVELTNSRYSIPAIVTEYVLAQR